MTRLYDVHVATRVTEKQRRDMERAARAMGIPLSTWLRVVALAALDESKRKRGSK